MKKRIAALILAVFLLFAMIPTVYAEEDAYTSTVLKDLSSMHFDGKSWDIRDFPKKEDDPNVYLIAVDEKGFRKNGNLDDYELNVYVYNPSGQAIANTPNKAQMAVAWNEDGTVSEYEKFTLMLKGFSTEEGYENVFIKYRVFDHKSAIDGKTMKERLLENKTQRRYVISSFELKLSQDGKIKDFNTGCEVFVRGYDEGCGEGNTISTKQITYRATETLELDVRQAYWRTQSSDKGVNYKHQINSAYFSVPNEIWDKYEELYSIKCVWEEHNTRPMIVTDDEGLYDLLMAVRGVSVPPGSLKKYPQMFSNFKTHPAGDDTIYTANYAFNPYGFLTGKMSYSKEINPVGWVFLTDKEIELNKNYISVDEVRSFYEKYGSNVLNHGWLLYDTVDAGREQYRNGMTVYFDDASAFDLSNYDSSHGWFQKLVDYNLFNGGLTLNGFSVNTSEVYSHFTPIEVFGAGDKATSSVLFDDVDDLMDKHFLGSADQVVEFRTYLADAVENEETVVLFRYASTDYLSEMFSIYNYETDGHAFVSTQTVFLDFDVIQLQFKDEEMNIVTLAVASDPEDVFAGIDSPTVSNDPELAFGWLGDMMADFMKAIKIMLIVVVTVAVVVLVIKGVEWISNASFKSKVNRRLKGSGGRSRRKKK